MPVSDEHVARKFLQTLNSATERKIEFNMTLSYIRKLLNQKKCFYTGIKMLPFSNTDPNNPHHRTFDRVDNTKGYTNENVVACIYEINQFKSNMSIKEILRLQKTLTILKNGITKHEIYKES